MILGFNTEGRRNTVLLLAIWLLVMSYSLSARAGVERVEIQHLQFSRTLSVTVTDPSDSPVPGAKVEEMSSDWKQVLRSTDTDDKGRFALAPVHGRDLLLADFLSQLQPAESACRN